MKDLITTMAAVTILMIFVMQFASNQIVCSRVALADKTIENFQITKADESKQGAAVEELRLRLAECLGCNVSNVVLQDEEDKLCIRVPLKGIIACGDFLGIDDEENMVVYRNEVWKEE